MGNERKCILCGEDISDRPPYARYCRRCAAVRKKITSRESKERIRLLREKFKVEKGHEYKSVEKHKFRFMRVVGGWRGRPCAGGGINPERKFCDFGTIRSMEF